MRLGEPCPHGGGDKLRTIVRPDVGWWYPDDEIGECSQHVFMFEQARYDQRETFPAGLVDDGEDPKFTAVRVRPSTKS